MSCPSGTSQSDQGNRGDIAYSSVVSGTAELVLGSRGRGSSNTMIFRLSILQTTSAESSRVENSAPGCPIARTVRSLL
jgi:hypothetical protein